MAYTIDAGETIPEAIHRLVIEQIRRAKRQLSDRSVSGTERVHNARKRLKEIRAVLRLVRPALGTQFAVENASYRDIGGELSAVRDAQIVIEAIETLRERDDAAEFRAMLQRTRRILMRHRNAAAKALDAKIADTLAALRDAQSRLEGWPQLDDPFATIGDGIERTYRQGRRAFRRALADPTPEHLHGWRKRAKDHWHHLQLLRRALPHAMRAHRKATEELCDLLGQHHDLTVLRQVIVDEPRRFGNDAELRWLLDAVDAGRADIGDRALALGDQVYDERPRRWIKRIEQSWDRWHELKPDPQPIRRRTGA